MLLFSIPITYAHSCQYLYSYMCQLWVSIEGAVKKSRTDSKVRWYLSRDMKRVKEEVMWVFVKNVPGRRKAGSKVLRQERAGMFTVLQRPAGLGESGWRQQCGCCQSEGRGRVHVCTQAQAQNQASSLQISLPIPSLSTLLSPLGIWLLPVGVLCTFLAALWVSDRDWKRKTAYRWWKVYQTHKPY